MFRSDITVTGLEEARQGIGRLRQFVPKSMVELAKLMYQTAGTAPGHYYKAQKTPPDMGAYMASQPVKVDDSSVSWGLPVGDLNARIARFRESGGTIRPVNAKMLRIPLPPALTAAGVDRYAGVTFRDRTPWSAGERWFVLDRGTPLLCQAIGKGKYTKVTPMYVLAYSATIRPHVWFAPTVDVARAGLPTAMRTTLESIQVETK